MSEYEFWDELGNIFNAIVAYQHKTIEFNKRYVNPWLRLGTVLDQNDHNADALIAHKKAIEIDQENGSNWLSLGDVYFKMGSFDDAIGAYSKAIELNPRLGWAFANLALAYTSRQRYSEAVNCYVKSLELIDDEKDRAMIWNRLGNVYRKVNDYDNAFIAFQMADECDGQNTGFDDQPDEVTVEQKVMPIVAEVYVNNNYRAADSKPVAEQVESETVTEQPATEVSLVEEQAPVDEIAEASTEVIPAVTEAEVVTEVPAAEESVIAEICEHEVASVLEEAAEPAIAETSMVDESAPLGEVAEQKESAVLTDEVMVGQQLPVESVVVEVAATAEVQTATSEIEELIYENIDAEAVLPEITEEMLITEPVAETSVDDAVVVELQVLDEVVTDETKVENIQPEVAANDTAEVEIQPTMEIAVEEAQQELAAEISNEQVEAVEKITEEVAPVEATPTPDETSTVAFVMSEAVETFADPSVLNSPVVLVIDDLAELIRREVPGDKTVAEGDAIESENKLEAQTEAVVDTVETVAEVESQPIDESLSTEVAEIVAEIVALASSREEDVANEKIHEKVLAVAEEVSASIADMDSVASVEVETDAVPVASVEPAYDEYLKDTVDLATASADDDEVVESKVAVKSELKVEPDTKNAHVWNELGNVYFNTGAFEEAVVAYSKAIELDDWFAWPYSNLALVYVQKEKYAEAILLYQRSIELFASDKEKAITWNRLGNVYRRLNDYDNAIACYQRADELDPNNATRSLRSRFSLLGSLNVEQASTLAA